MRSDDGGSRWVWSNHGYNGVMVGHSFTFNPRQPNLVLFPSQDYDAAVTLDGGDTWRRLEFSGQGWGGFTYGGYALSPDILFVVNRDSWTGPTELRLTRDGGETYVKTG